MIRELVLQFKLGFVNLHTSRKNTVYVLERFHNQLESLTPTATSRPTKESAVLSREGLLRVDSLLPRFFLPHHAGIRYT